MPFQLKERGHVVREKTWRVISWLNCSNLFLGSGCNVSCSGKFNKNSYYVIFCMEIKESQLLPIENAFPVEDSFPLPRIYTNMS